MLATVHSPVLRYGVAVLSVAVVLLVRLPMSPTLGPDLLMLFLQVAVVLSAWYGGLGPGLVATALVVLTATYLLPEPVGRWMSPANPRDAVHLGLFSGLGILISFLFASLKSEVEAHQHLLKQLQAEGERFHAFMDHSPTVSFIKDQHGRYLYGNELARESFGLALGEEVGKTALDLFPPEVGKRLVAADAAVFAQGTSVEAVETLPGANGALRHWLLIKFPFRDAASQALLGGIGVDITERREIEEQLEAARQHVFEAEVEKKRFTREVLRAATDDKLHLVEADEIPREGKVVAEFSLSEPQSYRELRHCLKETAEQAGMASEHADNLVLAAGEAVTNAIKHAAGGQATISVDPDQVIVRVTDAGRGIHPEDLPATVLQAGFSTQVSLGMGFTLMLQTSDQIWLATGPDGTVVQLAKWIHPEQHQHDPLLAILDRF